MDNIDISFIIEKLNMYFDEEKSKGIVEKSVKSANLKSKNSYTPAEMDRILDSMISQGGVAKFIARNAKIRLILK